MQMVPVEPQEIVLGTGTVLHCALLLLGYNSSSYEVEATPSMFEKANTKGMEALLHYLLSKIRGTAQARKAGDYLAPCMYHHHSALPSALCTCCRTSKGCGQSKIPDNRETFGR